MVEDWLRGIRAKSREISESTIGTYFHGIIDVNGTITPIALPPVVRGHFEPITNGDPVFPEILFDSGTGDVLMTQVED